MSPRPLRPHQRETKAKLIQSLARGSRRPLIQLPTGGGKTVQAADLIRGVVAQGRRAIFTVPKISLVDQTVEEFWREGLNDIGVIQADHPLTRPGAAVQVASLQTLARRECPPADLVIVDEAHIRSEWATKWLAELPCRAVGLSATPWAKGLGLVWDDLIIGATTQQLIDAGMLAPFKVFAPSKPDLSAVKTVAGEYDTGGLSDVMSKAEIVADVVTTWLERGDGRPSIVFAVDRAHAARLHAQFLAAGVKAAYLDGNNTLDERKAVGAQLRRGEISVVCNIGVLTTGVDWDVRCIVLARPTKSEMLYVQMIGRGLRTAPGKDHCTVLDHSSTTLNLGFVTDIHHDKLCDGKPDKSAQTERRERVAECSKCTFVRPVGVAKCPNCGHEPIRRERVQQIAGELVALDGSRAPAAIDRAARRQFHRELVRVCQDHGYKPGWAGANFRERYGVWPDWAWKSDSPADAVSPATDGWLKSRRIAFAKARQASEGRAA